uniref:Uncharacterized protein n=1 Tax=Anguilla anguilla TaxID=7936 RepID=A0A0E9V3D5_ANGAN
MNQIQFQFSKAIKTLIKQDAWSFGKDRGRENIINHQGTDLRICFGHIRSSVLTVCFPV